MLFTSFISWLSALCLTLIKMILLVQLPPLLYLWLNLNQCINLVYGLALHRSMQWNAHLDLEILRFKSCWALTIVFFFYLLHAANHNFLENVKSILLQDPQMVAQLLFSSLFQWKLLISMCADTSYTRYFPCTTLKGVYT